MAEPIEDLAETEAAAAAPSWARKYPPLLTIAIGLLIAVFVLPSSLNLPQTNPTQTLEYAPLPPDDQNNAPPQGNLAALGLGSSSGVQGGGAAGGKGNDAATQLQQQKGLGTQATQYRCVGSPPRQTEDPLAPPCVPYFNGNNFGATYQGVTGDEVKILIVLDPQNYVNASDASNTLAPTDAYYDVDKPCESYPSADRAGCNHVGTQGMRVWERYFDSRFQTYKRHVHFFVYWSPSASATADSRQGMAVDNYLKIKPFAVMSFLNGGFEDTYLRAMADRGVLNFGSLAGRTQAFYNEHPKLIWGYEPTVEQQSDTFSTYVCQKVVGKKSSFAGTPTLNGIDRKIGLVRTDDKSNGGYLQLAAAITQKVQACGGQIVDVGKAPGNGRSCLTQDNSQAKNPYGANTMGTFQREGITTILWPGCANPQWFSAAQSIGYNPEWILLGDGELEGPQPITVMGGGQEMDHHGIVVTGETFQPGLAQQRCYQAFREADPNFNEGDIGYTCPYYKNFFQLFTGIQVAGPRLGPTSIDQGFHAIPQHTSSDPQVPACFYNAGDYTCVKDAEAMWFDKAGQRPGSSRPGCYRAIQGGLRYLPGKWPTSNAGTDWSPSDPCNGYDSGYAQNLGPS